ncbi:hypothetical protein Tco_1437647 [Tanacetum coccineum]
MKEDAKKTLEGEKGKATDICNNRGASQKPEEGVGRRAKHVEGGGCDWMLGIFSQRNIAPLMLRVVAAILVYRWITGSGLWRVRDARMRVSLNRHAAHSICTGGDCSIEYCTNQRFNNTLSPISSLFDDYYEHIPPTGLDWEIINGRYHESSGVHTLEIEDGTIIHMLAERRYPLSRELMIRMLEHGMEVENKSKGSSKSIHVAEQTCLLRRTICLRSQTKIFEVNVQFQYKLFHFKNAQTYCVQERRSKDEA